MVSMISSRNNYYRVNYPIMLVWMLAVVSMLSIANAAVATEKRESPQVFLKRVTQDVLGKMRQKHAKIKNNKIHLVRLVDRLIIPHADFREMAKQIAGRNAWKKASKTDRKAFVDALERSVVKSYAYALDGLYQDTVTVLPPKSGYEDKKRVVVPARVNKPTGRNLQVSFRVIYNKKKQRWRVYDISVEGVSVLKSYRSRYRSEIQKGGLGYTARQLRENSHPVS